MNWFRKNIIGLFEYDLANRLLVKWMLIGVLCLNLPGFLRRYFFLHTKVGLWLYEKLVGYWFFWLRYYLQRDSYWPETEQRMSRNPLCPVGVWYYYKRILFEMTPEELTNFLTDKELQTLYRERQLRCGFVSQLLEST